MEIKAFTPALSALSTAVGASRAMSGKRAADAAAPDDGRRKAADTELARREAAQRAGREVTRIAAAPLYRGGSIEFEQAEGTRVMRVLDSKDILIYQVPPKGQLMLVHAAEVIASQSIDRA